MNSKFTAFPRSRQTEKCVRDLSGIQALFHVPEQTFRAAYDQATESSNN
jgi:hypothetical protein